MIRQYLIQIINSLPVDDTLNYTENKLSRNNVYQPIQDSAYFSFSIEKYPIAVMLANVYLKLEAKRMCEKCIAYAVIHNKKYSYTIRLNQNEVYGCRKIKGEIV